MKHLKPIKKALTVSALGILAASVSLPQPLFANDIKIDPLNPQKETIKPQENQEIHPWKKELQIPHQDWAKTLKKQEKTPQIQTLPPTLIFAEFRPTPLPIPLKDIVTSLQLHLQSSYPSPSGTDAVINPNQHWMEYSIPRYKRYGALHFIQTQNGILILHVEKNLNLSEQDWETQKNLLKGANLSQKTNKIFFQGQSLMIPTT